MLDGGGLRDALDGLHHVLHLLVVVLMVEVVVSSRHILVDGLVVVVARRRQGMGVGNLLGHLVVVHT